MSYKSLKLNLSECEAVLQSIADDMGGKLSSEKKGNDMTQFSIEISGKGTALLNIYDTAKGLNITSKVGKLQEISDLIASKIATSCENVITKTHTFKSITEDLYNEFVEFFQNDYKISPHTDDDVRIIIRISTGKPELTVSWFKTTHTLMVQGRTTSLWDDVILWFAGKICEKPEGIIELVFDSYEKLDRTRITYDDVLLVRLFKKKIGDVYSSSKILKSYELKWLKTSLFLIEMNLELPEYYPAISSAIKVIEGLLRRICMNKFGPTSFNGRNFDQFQESATPRTMQLKPVYKSMIRNSDAIDYIEGLYGFIKTKRHPYMHNYGAAPAELTSKPVACGVFDEVITLVKKSMDFERELF